MKQFIDSYFALILNDYFPLLYVFDIAIPLALAIYLTNRGTAYGKAARKIGGGLSLFHTVVMVVSYLFYGFTEGFGPSRWGSSSGLVLVMIFFSLPVIVSCPFFFFIKNIKGSSRLTERSNSG